MRSERQTQAAHRIRDAIRGVRDGMMDTAGLVPTYVAALWLRRVRRRRINLLPKTRATFQRLGVYPIVDHYYEPLIDRCRLDLTYRNSRRVRGIDWRESHQWSLLERFEYQGELERLPRNREAAGSHGFYLHNGYFGAGDADLYYSLIRLLKPNKIVEVGSGHSSRLASMALQMNAAEGKSGKLVCIEPYRHPDWFEDIGATHVSRRVEDLGADFYQDLAPGDIFFVDSSHMIRPQGDVLYLLMEVLPALPAGVYVHVHDIFSPLDYPNEWVVDGMNFWNEQYLVEALLVNNAKLEVVAGMQYLLSRDRQRLESLLPNLEFRRSDIETTSLWLKTC